MKALSAGNRESFCKGIVALSKYEKLEDAFYEQVRKIEGRPGGDESCKAGPDRATNPSG